MAGFFDIIKHLFVPALIALTLYGLLVYVAIPIYRSQRDRYAQYLPIETLSSHTNSLRHRITDGITDFILRRSGNSHRAVVDGRSYHDSRRGSAASGDEPFFGEEEGESMVGFDMGRRERIRENQRAYDRGSERRLSRELEEGFMDDSDSEGAGADDRRR